MEKKKQRKPSKLNMIQVISYKKKKKKGGKDKLEWIFSCNQMYTPKKKSSLWNIVDRAFCADAYDAGNYRIRNNNLIEYEYDFFEDVDSGFLPFNTENFAETARNKYF